MRIVLVLFVLAASAAAQNEAVFDYEQSFVHASDHGFVRVYRDATGHRVLLRAASQVPTELEHVARIRYRAHPRIERMRALDGGDLVPIHTIGEVLAFDPIPIETAQMHLVARYLSVCAAIDRYAEVYESADGLTRLVVHRAGAFVPVQLSQPRTVSMRIRRTPDETVDMVRFACMGPDTVPVTLNARAVPPI